MSSPIITTTYHSPAGILILGDFNGRICLCDWMNRQDRHRIDLRLHTAVKNHYHDGQTSLLCELARQLDLYFEGRLTAFAVPFLAAGTEFQKKVWQEILSAPYGQTLSYKNVAYRVGNKNSVRAVARAVGANPLSIIIPCHRIISSNGTLTGYAGGIEAKKFLLDLERSYGK